MRPAVRRLSPAGPRERASRAVRAGTTPGMTDVERDAERLTEPDWLEGLQVEAGTQLRAALANAMVGLKKHFYGKGPEKARAYVEDQYVFVVLEGGLTRNEQTMVDRGEDSLVRDFRLRFQEVMAPSTLLAVERLTGRRVVGYHSQLTFEPTTGFEIFRLDAPPDG
jgi:uncharacterized protein YbcI